MSQIIYDNFKLLKDDDYKLYNKIYSFNLLNCFIYFKFY